jgi:hypothetical protein
MADGEDALVAFLLCYHITMGELAVVVSGGTAYRNLTLSASPGGLIG